MKFVVLLISAWLFFTCNKAGRPDDKRLHVVRDTDGITVIEAAFSDQSDQARVQIMMRPELKRTMFIYWTTRDDHNRIEEHVTPVTGGVAHSVTLYSKPGSQVRAIDITGYAAYRAGSRVIDEN
jgi:hypothetical protein